MKKPMTLIIELTSDQESRLAAFARQAGLAPAEVVKKLVEEHLPPLAPPSVVSETEQARRAKVMDELIEETERLGLYK